MQTISLVVIIVINVNNYYVWFFIYETKRESSDTA